MSGRGAKKRAAKMRPIQDICDEWVKRDEPGQVHVYGLPDDQLRDDASLCSDSRAAEMAVVYHINAREFGGRWRCWACGITPDDESGTVQ